MLNASLEQAKRGLETIRRSIRTSERLRELIAAKKFVCSSGPAASLCFDQSVFELGSPGKTDWIIFDHCAAIMRLYAIYESFVRDLLAEWLAYLQGSCLYMDLPNGLKEEHRRGIAQILAEIEKRKYSHLSSNTIVKEFHDAISGVAPYQILPESLISHDQNLRMEELIRLFSKCGIENCKGWIESHKSIRNFFEVTQRESDVPDAELRQLIDYRNDAAHGSVTIDQVLSIPSLVEYIDFIEVLLGVLVELIYASSADWGCKNNSAREVGRITELFSGGAVVAIMDGVKLSIGQRLFLKGPKYCYSVQIESIHDNDIPLTELIILQPKEVGLKFNLEPIRNSKILEISKM